MDSVIIPDAGVDVENATSVAEGPVPKKRKTDVVKPPKGKEPVVEKVICDSEGKDQDGEPIRVGTFTLEQLASTIFDIHTDQDWIDMQEAWLSSVLKRIIGHWGHVRFPLFQLLFVNFMIP